MTNNQQPRVLKHQPNKPSFNKYAKFSAIAFQWIGAFVSLSLGGNWLDKYLGYQFPAFTLAGVFLALSIIFYAIYKLASNQNENSEHNDL